MRRGPAMGWMVNAVLAATLASAAPQAPPAGGHDAGALPFVPHLRHADHIAAGLLAEGRRRSATFRALADAVEAADVLVFVETSDRMACAGATIFVGHAGATRILRVRVRVPGCPNALVAKLGHELQHVVEVTATDEVQCEESMAAFYERTGTRVSMLAEGVRRYETAAGPLVEGRILDELRHPAPKVARR